MEILTQENTDLKNKILILNKLLDAVEEVINTQKTPFNGDFFITDKELSDKLKISRRALQDYRNKGLISYFHIGGKILYKEADINKLLNENHVQAFYI